MPTIPISQLIGESSQGDSTQTSSSVIPIAQLINNQSSSGDLTSELQAVDAQTAQEEAMQAPPKEASGVVGTTLGAGVSGLMKGGEGMLLAEQGAVNLGIQALQKVGLAPQGDQPQYFAELARNSEEARLKIFGEQKSLHGKVLETIFAIPSIVAMTEGGAGGVLMGASKFAALNAVQTKGVDQNATVGDMTWSATKGAALGAVLGKAASMAPVDGTIVAGAANAALTALEGGDSNDILAGALVGSGLNIMSNPKNLSYVLTAPERIGASAIRAKQNVTERMNTGNLNPLEAVESILTEKTGNYLQDIKAMNESSDRIKEIQQNIDIARTEKKEMFDKIRSEQEDQKRLFESKSGAEKQKTTEALSGLEKEMEYRIAETEAYTRLNSDKIAEQRDIIEKDLGSKIKDVVLGLKNGGKIDSLFKNISSAYEKCIDGLSESISVKAPITRLEAIDMLTKSLERMAANGVINDSPVAKRVQKYIDILNGGKNETGLFRNTNRRGVTREDVNALLAKGGTISGGQVQTTKSSLSDVVTFKDLKQMVTDIKTTATYGSHEADLVRLTFGDLISKKLQSPDFDNLQRNMSDAISFKNKLSRVFQLKEGTAYWEGGVKFLHDIAIGKEGDPALLDFMQKGIKIGSEQAPGVGDVFTEIKSVAEKFTTAVNNFERVGSTGKAEVAAIGAEYAYRIAEAKSQGKLSVDRLNAEFDRSMEILSQKKKQTQSTFEKAMQEARGKLDVQKELLKRKTEMGRTINSTGYLLNAINFRLAAVMKFTGRMFMQKHTGFGVEP